MPLRQISRSVIWTLVGVALVGGSIRSSVAAGELLRWKFKAGDDLHYRMVQDTQIRTVAAAKTGKTSIAQTIDMTWKVTSVDADGVAEMTQTIDRMRMKATSPEGVMEADSASDQLRGGLAQNMTPVFKALINAPFKLKMAPDGRISDVEVPARAIDALKENPSLGALLNAESLKQMTTQASIPLPKEPVDAGAKWTDEKDLAGVKLLMTYTYTGPADHAGRQLQRIATKADLEMSFPENEGVTAEMEEGELTGQMFFDVAVGQLIESEAKQKMVISIVGMGQSLRQEIQSLVNMRLVPPGEKEEPPATQPDPQSGN